MRVRLTRDELGAAIQLAKERYTESRGSARRANHGFQGSFEEFMRIDVLGAAGEFACAKALDVPLPIFNINTFKRPDLESLNVQVRTTTPGRRLIIRYDDPPEQEFYLVVACAGGGLIGNGSFDVVGSIVASDAFRHNEWRTNPNDRGTAWFVPQHALKPL